VPPFWNHRAICAACGGRREMRVHYDRDCAEVIGEHFHRICPCGHEWPEQTSETGPERWSGLRGCVCIDGSAVGAVVNPHGFREGGEFAMRPSLLAALLVIGAAPVFAKCGDQPGDNAAVLAAREDAATSCPCVSFTNHGQYVKCVKGVANTRSGLDSSDPNFLPKDCKSAVVRCAAHSVCGKSGFVTCCIPDTNAIPKCKTKRDEMHCTDAGGMVGGDATTGCASCCDACPTSGNPPGSGPSCVASTSTTTSTTIDTGSSSTTTTTIDTGSSSTMSTTSTSTSSTTSTSAPGPCALDGAGGCAGTCADPLDVCGTDPTTGQCGCFLPCAVHGGFGSCGGVCPASAYCGLDANNICRCITPCHGTDPQSCGGECAPGQSCVYDVGTGACVCG
jgi:hypothetical protein